ncbi:MAG: hypothetical protein JWL64_1455 [Frankiales bacterium]|nr:hypothetical protein [Frankiales bacterium]
MSNSDSSTIDTRTTGAGAVPPPLILSDLELIALQLQALERWHAARREQEQLLAAPGQSREQRLVSQRRLAALAAVHRAVMARSDEQVSRDPDGRGPGRARAVLAHRNLWLRGKVGAALEDLGVTVVASVDDGAEALAAVVCLQPELILVEDRLPTVPGREVVGAAAGYAPHTVIAVQAEGQEGLGRLLDLGVRAWFSRRIPPAEIAARLVETLHRTDGDILQLH